MKNLIVTLGDILLFDAKLPPGVYIVWNAELEQPVYIGRATIGCDQQIIDHWRGGPTADRGLNSAMHGSEPYSLDWTVEVYPAYESQASAELELGLLRRFSPMAH